MQDLASWLSEIGLEQHAQAMLDNDIDMDILTEITDQDLKELGISIGHRRKMLAAIKKLSSGVSADDEDSFTYQPSAEASENAEHRQLTVLFCDLVGSTDLSQRLNSEDLREVMIAYQGACKEAIEHYNGFIAKYMGDGLLVYFGYPQAYEEDARLAVLAGLEIVKATRALNQTIGDEKDVNFAVRVGISTGSVIVGDLIGRGASREYGVVGETLNLAARLQAIAKPDTVVISPSTHKLTKNHFQYQPLGLQEIKGFKDPVDAWQVIGAIVAGSDFEATSGGQVSPLTGREEESEILYRRWKLSQQGRGQIIFLSGEPGIGKSRLVQNLLEQTSGENQIRLRYQCSEHRTNSPLYPYLAQIEYASGFKHTDENDQKLSKVIETLHRIGDRDEKHIALLASLLSISLNGRYEPYQGDPRQQRQETLKMLKEQFELLASTRPILCVFEDIHWIDPSSRELLDRMVERISQLPVMLILTFRPTFSCPWTGLPHSTLMVLNRLTREEILKIVEKLTAGKDFAPELIEHIVSRTDGVPLFVEELTKVLLETDQDGAQLDDDEASDQNKSIRPPETLQDSLTARLDRLGPGAKSVAQTCAVIGRSFSYRLLARVSDLQKLQLDPSLDKLIEADIMSCRGSPPESTYTFKHALIQDTAYQSMLSSRRTAVHGKVADVLYEHFPEDLELRPEVIAYHYLQAERSPLALDYFEKAAKRTLARSNYVEGINHLKQALNIIEATPESSQRDEREVGIQSALGGAMIATRGFAAPETGETFERAADLYKRIEGDTSRFNPVRYGVWVFHLVRSEFEIALELAEEFVSVAESQENPTEHLVAYRIMGSCLTFMGRWALATDYLDKALSLYDLDLHRTLAVSYAQDPRIAALTLESWALLHLGRFDEATSTADKALSEAQDFKHLHTTAYTLGLAGTMFHQFRGDLERTRQGADALVEMCSIQPVPLWSNLGICLQGWAKGMEGEIEAGIRQLQAGYDGFVATGAQLFLPYYISLKAEVYVKGGQHEKAIKSLDAAKLLIETNEEGWFSCDFHRIYGDLCRRMKLSERADAAYHTGLELARKQGDMLNQLRCTMGLAEIAQTSVDKQAARYKLDEIYKKFNQGLGSQDLVRARELLDSL